MVSATTAAAFCCSSAVGGSTKPRGESSGSRHVKLIGVRSTVPKTCERVSATHKAYELQRSSATHTKKRNERGEVAARTFVVFTEIYSGSGRYGGGHWWSKRWNFFGGGDEHGGAHSSSFTDDVRLFAAMMHSIQLKQVFSNSALAAATQFVSELVSQSLCVHMAESRGGLDWRSLASAIVLGAVLAGPVYTVWCGLLSACFAASSLGTLKCIAADQLVFAFGFNYMYELCAQKLQGDCVSSSQAWACAESATKRGWCFWPAVLYVNRMWIPTILRTPLCKLAQVFWKVSTDVNQQKSQV